MMDTLLTTFLTTTPIMVPSWTLIEKYFVEVDFTSSSSLNKNSTSDYFAVNLSVKKSGGEGDCCMKESKNEMCISPPFIMEFQNITKNCRSIRSPAHCPSETVNNSPLYWYFQHQLHHMAVNRRMRMQTLQTSKCCSSFGMMSNCSRLEHHSCCKAEYSKTTMYRDVDETPSSPCPCELREEVDQYCDVHGIIIQDIEMMERSCMWTISFHQTLDEDEDDGDSDEYFVNPCYEDECENNLLDDTFEIEFTNEVHSSFNPLDLTNVNFTIQNSDEFIYGFNDSHCSSFVYELPDDEEDCNMIFDSGLVVSQSWNADFTFSNSDTNKVKKQIRTSFHQNTFPLRPKKISKYHTKCTQSSNDNNNNSNHNNNNNNNKRTVSVTGYDKGKKVTGYGKGKKKVHFPEEEDKLVTVRRLVTWTHAHREARKSVWFRRAQERCHFRRRIMNVSELLNPVLKRKYRQLNHPENY